MNRNQRVNYIKFEWGTDVLGLMYLFNIIFRFNADFQFLFYHKLCMVFDAIFPNSLHQEQTG